MNPSHSSSNDSEKSTERKIPCAFTRAAQTLSGRWDLTICYKLLDGPMRFNEIKEELSQSFGKTVHSASLVQSLKRLERLGIIKRKVDASTVPISVQYSLTHKGASLKPALMALKEWGEFWLPEEIIP